jgi:hypothetical protein
METWILGHLGKEVTVISGAPMIFGFTWLLGLTLIWWILNRYVYRSRLELKDDLIKSYKEKLGLLPCQESAVSHETTRQLESLGKLIEKGQGIRFRYPFQATTEVRKPWEKELDDWMNDVERFLKSEMAPKALTKFRHVTGIEECIGVTASPTSMCPLLDRQIQNLVDIMERIELYL